MSERVTDEMVKRAALAVSDQLDGGYRGHWCAEHDDRGRGCERCREIAHAALAAARIETGEVADERDELRARVAELEVEVESWQTRRTVDGARVTELEKAVRRYRGASQLYAMVLGGGWMRTAAGRRREQDARRELRAACDALDALLPDAEDRGQ